MWSLEFGVWSFGFGVEGLEEVSGRGSRKRFQEVSGGGLRKSWVEDNRSLSGGC